MGVPPRQCYLGSEASGVSSRSCRLSFFACQTHDLQPSMLVGVFEQHCTGFCRLGCHVSRKRASFFVQHASCTDSIYMPRSWLLANSVSSSGKARLQQTTHRKEKKK